MPRCYIDMATSRGLAGWAVGLHQNAPCRLRVELSDAGAKGGDAAGRVVARAVARNFRRDLLAAGIGHGHYGFTARFAEPVAPGSRRFALIDEATCEPIPGTPGATLTVTAAPPAAPLRVEDLLEQVDHWIEADLAGHAPKLCLDANMAAMGIPRFVAVTFRYVLNRWPDAEGGCGYETALRMREITAETFFRTLVLSDERRRTHVPFVSPYDAQFPYDLGESA